MKKFLITSICIMLFFGSFSQSNSCTLAYLGPNSVGDLQKTLSNSSNPVLSKLDPETVQSLLAYSVFINGIFSGFSGTDENIQKLYNSNMGDVLSAILNTSVIMKSGPVCKENNVTLVSHGENLVAAICSFCTNCAAPESFPIGCCYVPGGGCCDFISPLPIGGSANCTK